MARPVLRGEEMLRDPSNVQRGDVGEGAAVADVGVVGGLNGAVAPPVTPAPLFLMGAMTPLTKLPWPFWSCVDVPWSR